MGFGIDCDNCEDGLSFWETLEYRNGIECPNCERYYCGKCIENGIETQSQTGVSGLGGASFSQYFKCPKCPTWFNEHGRSKY